MRFMRCRAIARALVAACATCVIGCAALAQSSTRPATAPDLASTQPTTRRSFAPQATHVSKRTEVPILQNRSGLLVVECRVNGKGSFRFCLDTGADRAVIRPALAEKI